MGVITQNLKLAPDHYLLSLSKNQPVVEPKPGQFYMLRCSAWTDPLLRRPLSIHGYTAEKGGNSSRLDFLYRIVGKGTKILSQMKPGDPIDLFGPLGKGFHLPKSLEYALFIAGGIGIAPLPYLAKCLVEKQKAISGRLLIGAKTAEQILGMEAFKKSSFEIFIYTEDWSMGEMGCVTDDLNHTLESCLHKKSMVFACGPAGMLGKVAEKCLSLKIPCQVSLDRRMACGVGACQGCVVRASGNSSPAPDMIYKRVCVDGPVFQAHEIFWPAEKGEEQCPL